MEDPKKLRDWFLSEKFAPKESVVIAGASYYDPEVDPVVYKRNITISLENYRNSNPYSDYFNYVQSPVWEIEFGLQQIVKETLELKFNVELETTPLSSESKEKVVFVHSLGVNGAIRISKVDDEIDQWAIDVVLSARM